MRYDGTSERVYSDYGIGLNQGIPWRFRVTDTDKDFTNALRQYFGPMLDSLNIYANP